MTAAGLKPALATLAMSLLACSGTHGRGPEELEARDGGPDQAGSGAAGMGAAGENAAGQGAAGSNAQDIADVGIGTWVGEIMTHGSQLCDPKFAAKPINWGSSDGTYVPDAPDVRIALVIEGEPGALRGRIAFGQGNPPASPYPHPDGSPNVWDCPSYLPAVGATYDIEAIVQRDRRLVFEIQASQIWNAWCAQERYQCSGELCSPDFEVCDCSGDPCRATQTTTVLVDLVANDDSMEGFLHGRVVLAKLPLRLFRAR